jgi:SET domain-containing protein
VQEGSKCQFQVYYVNPDKEWAVRSLKFIAKGEFVMEYTGQVMLNEELNDTDDDTYDFHSEVEEVSFTIRALHKGNVARFVNHSCNPNMIAMKVVWNHIPHVACFALRAIQPGEELTLDYGAIWWDAKRSVDDTFGCACGEQNCRYRSKRIAVYS